MDPILPWNKIRPQISTTQTYPNNLFFQDTTVPACGQKKNKLFETVFRKERHQEKKKHMADNEICTRLLHAIVFISFLLLHFRQ